MAEEITVLIPSALRPQVGGEAAVSLPGSSVREVFRQLIARFPQVETRLFTKDGELGPELNRFINVYVNDEDIRFLEHIDTEIFDGDEITIVPAIAGG